MTHKIKDKKTNRPKKTEKKIEELTFIEKIALLSECSPQYVGMILGGKRAPDSDLAQTVLVNAEKIKEHDNKLLALASKLVPINRSRLFIEQ